MLSVLPRRYGQIAMSIETLVDLDMPSINEHRMSCSRSGHAMAGRLNAAEVWHALDHDLTAGIGKLLLTEEWRTRTKSRGGGSSDGGSSGGGSGGDRRLDQGRDRGKDVARRDGNSSGATRDDECLYCGKKGYRAREWPENAGRRRERKRTWLARPTATAAIRTSSWLLCMIISDRAYTRADILKMGNLMSSFPLQQRCTGTLAKKFAAIRFKDGETVDNFAIRITGMMSKLALLGKIVLEG
ncbi:hypothetical protein QYE76_020513 [Lolium multiflorum]|uniref:CCHC-type domain-containing protein n=1 Tax=Lolium multiflorum TaxID=4521 RepID=A0AAD8R6J7_LOLMU|nr:hypothetical protein QYE76_020513 [Lolium multiflorum]